MAAFVIVAAGTLPCERLYRNVQGQCCSQPPEVSGARAAIRPTYSSPSFVGNSRLRCLGTTQRLYESLNALKEGNAMIISMMQKKAKPGKNGKQKSADSDDDTSSAFRGFEEGHGESDIIDPQGFAPVKAEASANGVSFAENQVAEQSRRPMTIDDLEPLKPYSVPKRVREEETEDGKFKELASKIILPLSGFLILGSSLFVYIWKPKVVTDEQIETRYEQMLIKNPEDGEVMRVLADTKISLKKYEEALPLLEKLSQTAPDDDIVAIVHAQDLITMNRASDASGVYEDFLKRNPYNPKVLQKAIQLLEEDNKMSEAAALAEKAVAQAEKDTSSGLGKLLPSAKKPDVLAVKLILGQIYVADGNFDKSISLFTDLIKDYPRDWRPYVAKASALELQDPTNPFNQGQAAALYAQAQMLAPAKVKEILRETNAVGK